MTFHYYIISVFDGNITGTNDGVLAEEYAGSSDDFVLDTQTNEWIQEDGVRVAVPEKVRK